MKKLDQVSIDTIRALSADAIDQANSGHPGLPLGCAPMAYTLFSRHYRNSPQNLAWDNRDRFVLSAGHGSALLYSLFHVFGYGLTLDDLKNFRQFGSKTPGHPEYKHTAGVETSTGPLGMGVANAVGMALAEAHLAAIFNRPGYPVVDHYTYVITGDGCLMEGVSAEACSLAGTLGLGKLILLYDRNKITIEGSTEPAFTEDVAKRYEAYGWQVIDVADGNTDVDGIDEAIARAKQETGKPTIIIAHTDIGYGCPPVQGKAKSHGSPLGAENTKILKRTLGLPEDKTFYVPEEVYAHAQEAVQASVHAEAEWNALFAAYAAEYPELAAQYRQYMAGVDAKMFDDPNYYAFEKAMATRQSSGEVLNRIAKKLPSLVGGSADLASSNCTLLKERAYIAPGDFAGSNIHYGIREFAMGAIANGMYLHGGVMPFVATFLVFSDYLKHAVRQAALMQLPVIYVMTHDSIGVGEDGPTHEPVEQIAGLRAIPGSYTWRPADSKETAAAYECAFTADGPSVLALSRQNLPLYDETGRQAKRGGYVLKDSENPQVILIGTGSEVELCIKAYEALAAEGIAARVVSMPCQELFDAQPADYRESVLPASIRARLAVEAGTSFGWSKYVGLDGDTVCIDCFGASGKPAALFEAYGFTVENVVAKAKALLK